MTYTTERLAELLMLETRRATVSLQALGTDDQNPLAISSMAAGQQNAATYCVGVAVCERLLELFEGFVPEQN